MRPRKAFHRSSSHMRPSCRLTHLWTNVKQQHQNKDAGRECEARSAFAVNGQFILMMHAGGAGRGGVIRGTCVCRAVATDPMDHSSFVPDMNETFRNHIEFHL